MKTIILFLILSVIFEASITTLPIAMAIILFSAVALRKNVVFILAFFSGLFLDILRFGSIGMTSIFLVSFVFIIYLYQKKFEIDNLNFILVFTFIGSIIYLGFQSGSYIIFQAIILTIISGIAFFVYKLKDNKKLIESKYYG